MTLEKYYKDALDSYLASYRDSYLKPLASYRTLPKMPTELNEVLATLETLNKRLSELKSINVPNANFSHLEYITKHYDELEAQTENELQSIDEWAAQQKTLAEQKHSQELADADAYNLNLVRPLQDRHKQLLEYSTKLDKVFKYYHINALSIELSDDITRDEFEVLISESLAICKKYDRNINSPLHNLVNKLFASNNLPLIFSILGLFFLLGYFMLPFLSVPIFLVMFFSVHNMYKDVEKLKIAKSLMAQVDYNRFISEDEYQTVDEVDTTYIDDEVIQKRESVKDYSAERAEALKQAAIESDTIAEQCVAVTQEVKGEYLTVIDSMSKMIDELTAKKAEMLDNYIPFPGKVNDSLVMSHTYCIGKEYSTIDVTTTFPLTNMVFDARDRSYAMGMMKLFLCNALLSVRVKQLHIEIYDPKNMGGDFSEFIIPETKEYIKVNDQELGKLLAEYRKFAQENILSLDKLTIDEFNKKAEEEELVPKNYKLLLLVSEFNKLNDGESKETFSEFVKFSAQQGVMIWILDNHQYPGTLWITKEYRLKGTPITYTPELGREAVNTFKVALAKYKDRGIDYISKFGDVFIPREKWWTFDTISGINMPFGLEKGDPSRGLNVCPQLGDGNVHALLGGTTGAGKSAAINQMLVSLITMYPPSELMIIFIDFKNVEAAKFARGYDTIEKDWIDADLERKLVKEGEYFVRMSRIPHLKIISGTTDGEYALSVFEYLMKEMARRQELINKYGVTKIQSMREDILNKYNASHGTPKGTWADMRKDWEWYKPNVYDVYGDLPRLLVIFDEFQVMYNKEFVPEKVIDMINGKITAFTKLARAMGAHFWFTSQSMKGTMSKDTMANFSLRGALRCTKEVSEELIGNSAAGTIVAKFGYMYSNDTAGQSKDANRLWRVPFLDDKHKESDTRELRDIFDYIDKVNELLEPFNEQSYMAELYDEKTLVPARILNDWYTNYKEAFASPESFVLGERANYSINKAPVNMTLMQDSGENVMISGFDREDMLNLVLTLIDNLKCKEEGSSTLIMNVQDAETYTLLDVDNLVEDRFKSLASPKQDVKEFINALQGMVENRLERGGSFTPVFVFCVQWERAEGIGSEVNYKLCDDFKLLLRTAPAVGVHFIFACKEKMDLQRFIPLACNHRLAGLMTKDAGFFIDTPKVEKLPSHDKDAGIFAFYEFGTSLTKFKIYQHVFTNTIKSRDIVL